VWDEETARNCLLSAAKLVVFRPWSPDGKRLATGTADGTVKVWDAASKELFAVGSQDVYFLTAVLSPASVWRTVLRRQEIVGFEQAFGAGELTITPVSKSGLVLACLMVP